GTRSRSPDTLRKCSRRRRRSAEFRFLRSASCRAGPVRYPAGMPVVIPVIPVLALAFIACVSWLCGRRAGPLAALLVWAGAVAIGVAITALAFMLSPGQAWPDLLGAAVVLLLAL